MIKHNKNKPSALRFIDLLFIIGYAVIFICSILNFFGVKSISPIFLDMSELTFPLIVGGLLVSVISIDDILSTKFPISFHISFRIALTIQLVWAFYLYYQKTSHPLDVEQSGLNLFYYVNIPILLWIVRTLFQRIINIQKALNTSKK